MFSVVLPGTDFVAQMLLFNTYLPTYLHTYIHTSHRACRKTSQNLRLRYKECRPLLWSADRVSGPSQRKYGEHTIALIVCREKTAEPGGNRRRRRNLLTNYLLANNLPYIHTCIHTCMHTYIHAHMHTCTHTQTYIHTYIHTTQLIHTQLTHTYSSTHNLLHTNPSPYLFSFLLSPCHFYLSFAACWKKLTCGAIRSFNSSTFELSSKTSMMILAHFSQKKSKNTVF